MKTIDPEHAMQERTGPIFDLFMFLFVIAFLAFVAVRNFHGAQSRPQPHKDFQSHGTE